MILRSGFKVEAFISAIACTIARDAHARKDAADLTYDAIMDHYDVIYLAGGYWRAIPSWDAELRMIGVRLVNPDRTPAEIAIVEQGIAILCHFRYQE